MSGYNPRYERNRRRMGAALAGVPEGGGFRPRRKSRMDAIERVVFENALPSEAEERAATCPECGKKDGVRTIEIRGRIGFYCHPCDVPFARKPLDEREEDE